MFKSWSEIMLAELGITVDSKTGHLFYANHFKPLELNYDLVFIRHGQTFGNSGRVTKDGKIDHHAEKNKEHRVFQGDVDTEINQLTELGKKQAMEAADKLESEYLNNGWIPDFIYTSPLKRAKDTALPFITRHHFKMTELEGIREMSFGKWDNRRLDTFDKNDPCHSFYIDQNAIIKDGGENFCDVLLRAKRTLLELNDENHKDKNVLMYSHSMFGAACCILLGKGQFFENENFLAFDGHRPDGKPYTMEHATPFHLTKRDEELKISHLR